VSKQALWLLALQFAPAMLAKTPIVLETEGLGGRDFHGRVTILVNRHTASAAEMIVAFARENNLATIIGKKRSRKLLLPPPSKWATDSGWLFRLEPTTHGTARYLKECPSSRTNWLNLLGGQH
jgi:hypothetical protein